MAARHNEGYSWRQSIHVVSCVQELRPINRWRRGTAFQEIPPGAGFETGDFDIKRSWRGYRRTTLHIYGEEPVARVASIR